jgi:hypothetical protein
MAAGDGGDSAIMLDECDDAVIRNCYIYGNFDVGAIQFRTTASDRVLIHDCRIWTEASEDLAIDDHVTGSTGIIGPNIEIVLEDHTSNITEAIVFDQLGNVLARTGRDCDLGVVDRVADERASLGHRRRQRLEGCLRGGRFP